MSMIVTALALAAGAQAVPAATTQPSADHGRHHQQMPKDHAAKNCCCCEQMADGEKMACCDKHAKAEAGNPAGHSSH